ncbi:MAG: response regulator [Sphingobium sp.]|uniref:response regulator n=1 Tax=Sphingobium sp. TaxID=1912891 RepID=UPI0029B1D88D|nr:response regulator [Sphingobium sp.]MDX3911070.1 response regulator [Sphingobium sp.]
MEDEYLLANDLQSALEAAGYRVVGPFGRLSDQLDEAVAGRPDAAILDINLQGEMAYTVIEKLQALSVPVIVTTGYGRAKLAEHLASCRMIDKPYNISQIKNELKAILGAPNAETCASLGEMPAGLQVQL